MTLALPGTKMTVEDGGLGIVATPSQDVHVVMGCCSKGLDVRKPYAVQTLTRLGSDWGVGPAVKTAAYSIGKTGAQVVFVRLPAVTRTAQIKGLAISGSQTVTLTGTPNEGYDLVIVCTIAGTVSGGTAPTLKWSKDGGATFSTPALLAGTTLVLTGTGLTANFTATNVFAANDNITAWTIPAAQSIGPVTITRVGSSTCVITMTGAPEDDYDSVIFETLNGGTIGSAGITYRYSLDGGYTWSTKRNLGTSASITLDDGAEASGITVAFAAGTLDTGDTAEAVAFGPTWGSADALTAIDNLLASQHSWRFLHFVGWQSETIIAAVASKVADIAASAYVKHTFGLYSSRPCGTFERVSNWETRLLSEFSTFVDTRTGVAAGRCRLTCPMSKRTDRRTVMFPIVARIVSKTIQVDPGRRLDGPLGTDVLLHDDNKQLIENDSLVSSVLHGAHFITLRTYYDRPGIYVTRGNIMSAEDSDFNRIAYRAVMDLAVAVFNAVMLEQLENHLGANPAANAPNAIPGATPGALREPDARKIDRELYTALYNAIVAPGYASAVQARVSRTDPFLSTGKLTAQFKITPLGYVDDFEGTGGFINPQFAANAA